VKRVCPLLLAVKRSPVPVLSITKAAAAVLAAIEATGTVPRLFCKRLHPLCELPLTFNVPVKLPDDNWRPPAKRPLPAKIDPPVVPRLRSPDPEAIVCP